MSVYKTHAARLDAAYREAFSEYKKLYSDVKEAEYRVKLHHAMAPGGFDHNHNAEANRLNLVREEAERRFINRSHGIWEDFRAKRAQIRAELETANRAANLASPDAIDHNALELLKSGVLSTEDMAHFAEHYDSNPTMLRLIGKYAKDAAAAHEEQGDLRSAAVFNKIALDVSKGHSRAVRRFDELSAVADHCGASSDVKRMKPSNIIAMGNHWEDLAAPLMDD